MRTRRKRSARYLRCRPRYKWQDLSVVSQVMYVTLTVLILLGILCAATVALQAAGGNMQEAWPNEPPGSAHDTTLLTGNDAMQVAISRAVLDQLEIAFRAMVWGGLATHSANP